MKRFFVALFVGAMSVLLVPSCGGTKDTSQANLPEGVVSKRELRDMKENPENYTPEQLKAAGLDPSLGTSAEGAEAAPATP